MVVQAEGARVHVYATHLDYRTDQTLRQMQVADTLKILAADDEGATQVLLGDFDAAPGRRSCRRCGSSSATLSGLCRRSVVLVAARRAPPSRPVQRAMKRCPRRSSACRPSVSSQRAIRDMPSLMRPSLVYSTGSSTLLRSAAARRLEVRVRLRRRRARADGVAEASRVPAAPSRC